MEGTKRKKQFFVAWKGKNIGDTNCVVLTKQLTCVYIGVGGKMILIRTFGDERGISYSQHQQIFGLAVI